MNTNRSDFDVAMQVQKWQLMIQDWHLKDGVEHSHL